MGDDPGSPQLAYWLVLIILFVIHVFLAASEMAIVSSDKGKLQDQAEDGDRRAQRLLTLLGTPSRLITAIHMTMNVIGLGIAALLTVHFSPLVGVWLAAKTGIPYVYN
ncbi:MAG: CNNM domain-containing protein, partial [Peptococcus niger]